MTSEREIWTQEFEKIKKNYDTILSLKKEVDNLNNTYKDILDVYSDNFMKESKIKSCRHCLRKIETLIDKINMMIE